MKRDGNGWRPSSREESSLSSNSSEADTVISEPVALLQEERLDPTLHQVPGETPPEALPRVPDELLAEVQQWSRLESQRPSSYAGMLVDGRYLIESCIGQGGMSVVYRCRHVSIGKSLAMKIIRRDQRNTPEAPQRFLLEAKAASSIGNEHIIDIVDCGTLADGSAYLVMELLEGMPLSELIGAGEPLPLPRILSIVLQIAEGLSAAHAAGIVHRDLKPENIFLVRRKAEDFVKILDFGVAKMLHADGRRMTRTGYIVGTPHYMAPEQARGGSIDQRGDIYALGVILYELASGRLPFEGAHYVDVLSKHLTEPPPRLVTTGRVPAMPAGFEQIVHRCMAKRPDERFQSVAELAVELERLSAPGVASRAGHAAAQQPSSSSVPCAPSQKVAAPPRREHRGLIALGAVVSLLSLASLWHLRHAAAPEAASPRAAAAPSSSLAAAPMAVPAPTAELAPLPASPAMEPVTVVELGPGKTVEIEARTRLSLRLDEAGRVPEPALAVAKPKPFEAARRARPRPSAPHAPAEPAQPEPAARTAAHDALESAPPEPAVRAADELVHPWPAPP